MGLKIAMIGQKDIPSREGGVEVAVEALAVRMAAEGHDVTLYTCHRGLIDKAAVKKMRRCRTYRGVHIREVPVINVGHFGHDVFPAGHDLCIIWKI